MRQLLVAQNTIYLWLATINKPFVIHISHFFICLNQTMGHIEEEVWQSKKIYLFLFAVHFFFFYINFRPGFSHPRFSNATHFTYLNSIRSYYFYLFYIYRMCRCRYVSSVYLNFHFSSLTFRIVKIHIIPYSRLVPGCTTSSYPPNKPS